MAKLERDFQKELIKELKERFPGCLIAKMDANYIQGIPDLLILWEDRWALLECKKSSKASKRPNQEYYVELAKTMSYAAFIFPENKEAILNELEETFRTRR